MTAPCSLFEHVKDPRFERALDKNPAIVPLLELQQAVYDDLAQEFEIKPVQFKNSDESGRLSVELESGVGSGHFVVFSGPEIDWYVTGVMLFDLFSKDGTGAPYAVVKSMVYPNPSLLTPMLGVETGGLLPGTNDVLNFTCMSPFLNPFTNIDYLNQYYTQPPAEGFSSMQQLESEAVKNPLVKRYTSPFVYNRLFGAMALSYTGDGSEGFFESLKSDVAKVRRTWMEYLKQDCKKHRIPLTPELEKERDVMAEAVRLAIARDPHKMNVCTEREEELLIGVWSQQLKLHEPAKLTVK